MTIENLQDVTFYHECVKTHRNILLLYQAILDFRKIYFTPSEESRRIQKKVKKFQILIQEVILSGKPQQNNTYLSPFQDLEIKILALDSKILKICEKLLTFIISFNSEEISYISVEMVVMDLKIKYNGVPSWDTNI